MQLRSIEPLRKVSSPVYARHAGALAERGEMLVRLLPEPMTILGVVGLMHGIIDACDHDESPGQRYKDAVYDQGIPAIRLALGEGVVCNRWESLTSVTTNGETFRKNVYMGHRSLTETHGEGRLSPPSSNPVCPQNLNG